MTAAIQDTPVLQGARIYPLSVEAYHALGDAGLLPKNTELLYGVVYTRMPKSPLHASLIRILERLLTPLTPNGIVRNIEQPITCGDSEPEPAISFVAGRESDFFHTHPATAELVIEVCVTSHEYDRGKLAAYASARVKEVWLVLAPEQQIEVHRRPSGAAYGSREIHGPGGIVTSTALPEVSIDLAALFIAG